MQYCSKEVTLVRFFYNISSSSFLLLLFIYYSSILLTKFFNFIGSYPLIHRSQNEYEYGMFSEEEEEATEEEEDQVKTMYNNDGYVHYHHHHHHHHHLLHHQDHDHLVADIIHGGESLVFLHNNNNSSIIKSQNEYKDHHVPQEEAEEEEEEEIRNYPREDDHDRYHHHLEDQDDENFLTAQTSAQEYSSSPCSSESDKPAEDDDDQNFPAEENHNDHGQPNHGGSISPLITTRKTATFVKKIKNFDDESCSDEDKETVNSKKVEVNFSGDDENNNILLYAPTQLVSEKIKAIRLGKEKYDPQEDNEEIFGDSCTVGSTSKSSSEWRSSIHCRDSGTEDPFSSSSRRSCPKWESYTVFQKYDEEMMFLDRVSAQKLHETESLKSIQVCPRSISERLVYKFAKKPSDVQTNPYHELEAAYVAQICLTWEALNWNYKNFQRRLKGREFDPGCPAEIAQQFQQFQVLLQRYIENEPYEQGRRPEVYARMRLLAPKLLLVPEYRDPEDDQNRIKEEGYSSRISSPSFIMIMEEGIRTFMNFLKADKEKPCQILRNFFGRSRRGSVDPSLLHLMKKVNTKKRTKLKDLRRARNKCIRKRRLTVEEEIEVLMGLIDLKVVSRVLRMADLSEEQLHWCEGKMSKVRISDGKLQRDSSPLFFSAH